MQLRLTIEVPNDNKDLVLDFDSLTRENSHVTITKVETLSKGHTWIDIVLANSTVDPR